jgi:hypothetical protein
MYAHTWPSREAFNDHLRERTRRYSLSTDRVGPDELTRRLDALSLNTDVIASAVRAGTRGQPLSDTDRAALASLSNEYERQYGETLPSLHVAVTERIFDWNRGAFIEQPDVRSTGTLEVGAGVFHTGTTH